MASLYQTITEEIKNALTTHGPMTSRALVQHCEHAEDSHAIARVINDLRNAGAVAKTGTVPNPEPGKGQQILSVWGWNAVPDEDALEGARKARQKERRERDAKKREELAMLRKAVENVQEESATQEVVEPSIITETQPVEPRFVEIPMAEIKAEQAEQTEIDMDAEAALAMIRATSYDALMAYADKKLVGDKTWWILRELAIQAEKALDAHQDTSVTVGE